MKPLHQLLHRSIAAAACALAVAQMTPAMAGSDDDARKHFAAGESYFRTSDYDGALREFQMAHKLSKRPLILLNIANVYERMGNLPATIDYLQQYLKADPGTGERATIELRIQNLQKRIEAAPPTPQASAPPPPASAEPVQAPPPAPSPPDAGPPPSVPQLRPNRTPAYVAWGVGGAAAVGALVTGLIANGKYGDAEGGCAKTPQGCSDSELAPINTFALTSTILTGVAIVGVGAGTWLYLAGYPKRAERTSSQLPVVNATLGPNAASLRASWTF